LRKREKSAKDISEQPLPGERLEGGEGDGEETHDDVWHGQVEDEEVGHRMHVSVPHNDDRHQKVPEKSEAENDGVKKGETQLDRQSAEINLKKNWFKVIALWIADMFKEK